jgi:hypothetical protein
MEGVVILHETIYEMHHKKLDGVVFKIDFEKDYDKIKWSLLGFKSQRLVSLEHKGGGDWMKVYTKVSSH